MATELKEKVSFLEETLNRFIINSDKTLYRLSKEIQNLSDEMKEFKEEMKDFKDEMSGFKDGVEDFKDEMSGFKDGVEDFKDEMKGFKDEMQSFKEFVLADIEESRRERKEMNKRWGEITNKMGTFAEDVAFPNVPRIAKDYFGDRVILFKAVRMDVHNAKAEYGVYEFDGVAETENRVFLLESKYTARMQAIEKLPKLIDAFRDCFPQYADKELITIFASMSIPENMLKKLTKMGIYALALGDDNMDLLNFEALQKKEEK